ncbi:MAG: PD40 domain-containing protein [Sedimentisphaerales bacterium]|nr:PD40 domain-containing protein [Sedimentisphaerales bacterium]
MEAYEASLAAFLQWLLKTTLQGSLLICLIVAIKLILRERLPARWQYALWLILLVRLALPWTPQSRISIYNLVPRSSPSRDMTVAAGVHQGEGGAQPGGPGQERSIDHAGGVDEGLASEQTQAGPSEPVARLPASAVSSKGMTWDIGNRVYVLATAALLWLAGTAILAACVLVKAVRLWLGVRSERPVTDQQVLDLLEDCKLQMRVRTLVGVVVTDKVATPALFGFVRPRILLPQGLIETLDLDELHDVFLHELAHLKRRDIYLAWLVCLLQLVHWFNPLMWYAFRRMRADQEIAADALALASAGAGESHRYGRTIVKLLERFSRPQYLPSLAGILENPSHVERRMAMIAQFKNNSYRWSAAGIGIIVVLGAICMTDPTRATVSASFAPQDKAPMTMRLVQKTTGYVSVSPDGRYLCDCDTFLTEGIITIRELATGAQRTIKPTKSAPDENGPVYPVISPDGKTVAYGVGRKGTAYLCLIGADGSGQRDLCPAVRSIQWFPDGRRILGVRKAGDPKEIEIVSVSASDGSVQAIKALTGDFYNTTIRLSPDAKYVAYELSSRDAPAKRDIFATEIGSQRETLLVGHPANDKLLGWTPDGRHLLFASDRMGGWSVWLLPVAQGEAQGMAKLVSRDIGDVAPVGFTENGSYCYRLAYNYGNVYTATVNFTTGQLLSMPAPLEATGFNLGADWSPDGKYLAYRSQPAPVVAPEPGVIRIRSLATGEERELLHKIPTLFRCIRWSPDGRSLLASQLIAYEPDKAVWMRRVCRIDVDTGDTTVLLEKEDNPVWMAELSPDEKALYYSGGAIVRRQLETGEEKAIFTFPQNAPGAGWAISPNGEFIATGCNEGTKKSQWEGGVKKVLLIPAQGGPARELVRWEEPTGMLTNVAWSRDSKTVLFTLYKQSVTGGNAQMTDEFWQVPADGGEPRKITETELGMCYGVRVHPDGQRIAFSAAGRRHELWAMENFLPVVATTGAAPAPAGRVAEQEQARFPAESNVFVDPNTGVRFTRFKALAGPSDVENPRFLCVSPSGRFLLSGVHVIPLDGRASFDLVDIPDNGRQGSLSPDGRKVVYSHDEALWLIEIDPDTGRPIGSPRKLLDKQSYVTGGWSRDSQRITFLRADNQPGDARVYSWWTLSLEGGEPSPLTDPHSFGLLAPDGKTVAYQARTSTDGSSRASSASLLVRPVAGGEARMVLDGGPALSPAAWSSDSEWLVSGVWGGLEFIRIADGRHVQVTTPGNLIGGHRPGKKLLFYKPSYERRISVKLLSVAGGPPATIGWPSLFFRRGPGNPWWAQDSRSILVEGTREEDQWGLWVVPLDGKDPRPLAVDTPLCRSAIVRLFSPDGSHLLLFTEPGQGKWDLWTVPISQVQRKSTGPAIKIFSGMVPPSRGSDWAYLDTWSPDGSKVAFVHDWDIWVAGADGKSVQQLTKTPEREGWPIWSPDGTMIGFSIRSGDETPAGALASPGLKICVMPASGGPTKVIADFAHAPIIDGPKWAWFPGGKKLAIVCSEEGVIAEFAIAGGDRRTLVRLKDLEMEHASWLRWSPDGRLLAFQGRSSTDTKFYVYQVDDARLQRLSDEYVPPCYWSPDGKWICYYTQETVKTRPEGIVWEMDVDEAVTRLANQ